ncbi:MAG: tyrosine-protein phosphatase [Acidimicrobiales bacterium]|nr:tyrosine-protein phosphatase [Acidimicrobiales bacterium]
MQVGPPSYLVHGGIHRIPLPIDHGALYATAFSVVGPDPAAVLDHLDAEVLVCLLEDHEIERRFPDFAAWLADPAPHTALHRPVPDHDVVDDAAMVALVDDVSALLADGNGVLTHCGAGWGRTGVLAVLVLARLGAGPEGLVEWVRSARPAAGPQSPEQEAQLDRLVPRLVRRR